MNAVSPSNFGHLKGHDEQLVRLGMLAERYFADDPNTCLLKLRRLTEGLAQLKASRIGLFTGADEKQSDLLRRLLDHGILPREEVGCSTRCARPATTPTTRSPVTIAPRCWRLTWQLSVWFHKTFKDPNFKSGPFVPPSAPADQSAELQAELGALRAELAEFRAAHQDIAQALQATQAQVAQTQEERAHCSRFMLTTPQGGSTVLRVGCVDVHDDAMPLRVGDWLPGAEAL